MKRGKIVVFSSIVLMMVFVPDRFPVKNKQRDTLSSLLQKNAEALVREHAQTLMVKLWDGAGRVKNGVNVS